MSKIHAYQFRIMEMTYYEIIVTEKGTTTKYHFNNGRIKEVFIPHDEGAILPSGGYPLIRSYNKNGDLISSSGCGGSHIISVFLNMHPIEDTGEEMDLDKMFPHLNGIKYQLTPIGGGLCMFLH